MKFSLACFLTIISNSACYGFLIAEPCGLARGVEQRFASLNEGTNDDYDDWYDDFDPSLYDQYNDRDDGFGGSAFNPGHDYTRDTSVDQSNVDMEAVNHLISERLIFRKTGRFQEADEIRDILLEQHGVLLYDKDRTWRTGASKRGSGRNWIKDKKRGGRGAFVPRDFGPHGHDYTPSSDAGPNISSFSDDEIHELLAQRLDCKLNRRYKEADSIQSKLNEGGVYVNDGSKRWRADGRPFEEYSPRKYRKSSYSHDTDYLEEIQTLVDQRAKAKAERLFKRADEMRDTLRELYDVVVDDRKQEWSVGGNFGTPKRSESFSPFSMSPGSERPEDFEEVQRLVELRDSARSERDFDSADRIRDELMERNIVIDDRRREWSVGGFRRPRQEYSMAAGCVEPENYDEIQQLVTLRSQARAERDFEEADRIRDELLELDVAVNDKLRQWSVGGLQSGSDTAAGYESPFTRRGGSNLSADEEQMIVSLLKERDECKRDRHFQSADRIRDRLKEEFQVSIDDRNREWHIATSGYAVSNDSAPIADDVHNTIQEKVDDRLRAKLEKDYDLADEIRDELNHDYNVRIDDRTKEWCIPLDPELDEGAGFEAKELHDTTEESPEDDTTRSESKDVDPAQEELSTLTVPILKERLRDAGLPVSGRKAELIERLITNS